MNFARIRRLLVRMKVRIARTMSWVSMINSGMILFLVLSKLQDYGIKIAITRWFFPLYILVIILMMFFGYLEDKLGFFREETRYSTERNPQMKEVLERLERIEEKIK